MNTYDIIYNIVQKIPQGKVATYGQIAHLAGNIRWARVVGYALHKNPNPNQIPCYRVVNKQGELSKSFAFGGINKQKELLENEGIKIVNNRVDLSKYLWNGI